jgi:hypothetical protein
MPGRFDSYLFTEKTPYRWILSLIALNLCVAVALTFRAGFHGYFWWPIFIQFALLYLLYRDLSTGRAWVRRDTFHRESQPFRFWLSIIVTAFCYVAATIAPVAMHFQERAR